MKKLTLTRVMAVMLVIIMLVFSTCITNVSAGSIGDIVTDDEVNFKYQELSNGNIMITGADKYPSYLVIPAEIDGKKVEKIGLHAFTRKWQLETVVISEGIEVIGEYAFYECSNLANVIIPDSVKTIEGSAFYYCEKIEELYMVGAEVIGEAAFNYCTALERIYISKNLKEVQWGAFSDCDSLTEVYYAGELEDLYYLEIASYNDPLLEAYLHFFEIEPDVPTPPEYKMGDVNMDTTVDVIDATTIQRFCARLISFDAQQKLLADFDCDSEVSVMDATQIQRKLANLI